MKNILKLAIGIVLLMLMFSSVGWSQSAADIVLIIDSSGSMERTDPDDLRKRAASQLIDLADPDVQIGIVDFDYWAKRLTWLTFANTNGKDVLKDAVELIDSDGDTDIAAGLQLGAEVLNASTTFTARRAAVLLTDGFDSDPKTLEDYVGAYVTNGWSVYTIGLDSSGDVDRPLLEAIAGETVEGEYYSVTLDNIQSVYHTILAKITLKSVVLASPSGYINQNQAIEKQVKIDDWVTRANFSLSWGGSTIEMVLIDPNGGEITSTAAASLGISYQAAQTYAIYTVDNPKQGEWKMRLKGADIPPEGEAYSIVVTGTSDYVTNFLAFEPSYTIGDTVRIGLRIEEKTGDTAQPIIGATTSATVLRPDGRIEMIDLFDDGSHDDNAAGDGVYAGNYANLDKLGTYLIRVFVQNGFSREIQQQIVVGALDNVYIDGSTLIPGAGTTVNTSPRLISAVISGPAGRIDGNSIVMKIDGKVVAHAYDTVNQLVSFAPAGLSQGTHTVSLSVNDDIETNWTFTIVSGGISRYDTLMVLLDNELNLLKETGLGQNYPNPFNPETWIPYRLSHPTDVSIQIYDNSGKLVRTLELGFKGTGKYFTQSQAAYWDGKNAQRELVASGLYFYTLNIGDFTTTRRMLIRK